MTPVAETDATFVMLYPPIATCGIWPLPAFVVTAPEIEEKKKYVAVVLLDGSICTFGSVNFFCVHVCVTVPLPSEAEYTACNS